MGAARSEAATSAHRPASASHLALAAVKTMAVIPSAYATGTVHGRIARCLAYGLSVKRRAAAEGSEALSQYALAEDPESNPSQSSAAPNPTTTAPTRVAATPAATAATTAPHRRRISGHNSTGTSEGLSATTRPSAAPKTRGLSRRSEIHAATNPRARKG